MVTPFKYNSETRSFGIGSQLGLAAAQAGVNKFLDGKAATRATVGLGVAGAALGAVGAYKGAFAKTKFSVVYLSATGQPQHKTVGANSPMEAVSKVTKGLQGISKAKAFRLPDQDDQSQDYYNSLR